MVQMVYGEPGDFVDSADRDCDWCLDGMALRTYLRGVILSIAGLTKSNLRRNLCGVATRIS